MTSFINDAEWDRMVPYVQMEALNEHIVVSPGVASHITDAELDALRAVKLSNEQLEHIYEQAVCPARQEGGDSLA